MARVGVGITVAGWRRVVCRLDLSLDREADGVEGCLGVDPEGIDEARAELGCCRVADRVTLILPEFEDVRVAGFAERIGAGAAGETEVVLGRGAGFATELY